MNKLLRFLRKIFGVYSPSKLTISIPETMTAEEALEIITIGLLGANYYIVDPVGGERLKHPNLERLKEEQK